MQLNKETIAGNSERLKGYTIGVEFFDRGVDFDPNLDAIVRVEIGRLRVKLREYYKLYGQADTLILDLPKGSYVVTITLRDIEDGDTKLINRNAKMYPNIVEHKASLEVLPFNSINSKPHLTDTHEDTTLDYFADRITDSLIYELSRFSGLFFISRQSSFAYRNSKKTFQEIGEAFGVKYLLEGSLQFSEYRIRVTTKLIEAATGGHLWSERYESDTQEIFALQDEITLSVIRHYK